MVFGVSLGLLHSCSCAEMMLWFETCFHDNYPMKWGGTLMDSLFNVGLILLCSISVIQFCATAFAYYAQATAAQEIFGHTLQSLRGISIFTSTMFSSMALLLLTSSLFCYAIFETNRKVPALKLICSLKLQIRPSAPL